MKSTKNRRTGKLSISMIALASLLILAPGYSLATDSVSRLVLIELGDYSFFPNEIEVRAGSTIQLQLINRDTVVSHNFTLRDDIAGLDINVNLAAGKVRLVEITPLTPGSYKFYCDKKLPFMKSHRERGMEGTLTVIPAHRD